MASTTAETKKVAKLMRELDFCLFTTVTKSGAMNSRPMSNNREVEYDGDVWFFTFAESHKIKEIKQNPNVHLSYIDPNEFMFVSMSGECEIVTDVKKKKELWQKDLERWFENGPEDESVVLLKVRPSTIAYWSKDGDGEIA